MHLILASKSGRSIPRASAARDAARMLDARLSNTPPDLPAPIFSPVAMNVGLPKEK
jgi:hypothetical protein